MPTDLALSTTALPLLAAGGLGMIALGTVEVWSGHVGDSPLLLPLLAAAPVGVMVSTRALLSRRLLRRGTPALAVGGRTRRDALVGWSLLAVGAVLLLQAALFAASSALVQEIGCGPGGDDWCGFGSGIFAVLALVVGGTVGAAGAVLWLVTRLAARA